MSKVTINLDTLVGIGDAIRAKKGTTEQIPVANLASEIQSIQTDTPTATVYSYNGQTLPALPEWDKTAYPYAMIEGEKFYASAVPVTHESGFLGGKRHVTAPYIMVRSTNNDGVYWGEIELQEVDATVNLGMQWTNHNVLDENGDVYLEASEPVPMHLPLILYYGEVTTQKLDYQRSASKTIRMSYGYKEGDVLRITFNDSTAEYTATTVDTYNGVLVGNNGLNGNDDGVDDGGELLLTYPHSIGYEWASYFYTRDAGTYNLKIELLEVSDMSSYKRKVFDLNQYQGIVDDSTENSVTGALLSLLFQGGGESVIVSDNIELLRDGLNNSENTSIKIDMGDGEPIEIFPSFVIHREGGKRYAFNMSALMDGVVASFLIYLDCATTDSIYIEVFVA